MQEYFVYSNFLQRRRTKNPPSGRARGFVQRFPKLNCAKEAGNMERDIDDLIYGSTETVPSER